MSSDLNPVCHSAIQRGTFQAWGYLELKSKVVGFTGMTVEISAYLTLKVMEIFDNILAT